MISTPEVTQTQVVPAAVIHIRVPRSEMATVFGPAVNELMAVLAVQGLTPEGGVFAHHLTTSATDFDFELGVRVEGAVAPSGRVKPGQLPAVRAARTVYSGPYEGLHGAWGEFETWMTANGHKSGPTLWEVYSVGPQSSDDPADWRTDLVRPLLNP